MKNTLHIDESALSLKDAENFIFKRTPQPEIEFSQATLSHVEGSYQQLQTLLEKRVPIYGVNTGFGDSLFRSISLEKTTELQNNLISYLLCGTGPLLTRDMTRATLLFRLFSLSRGLSGVSVELLTTMKEFLLRDWLPEIPSQGSLGASGDLVPLAYLASMLRGEGNIQTPEGVFPAGDLFQKFNIKPYALKPKEGLAIVNGTSAMCGIAAVNLVQAEELVTLTNTATAWLCLALQGRKEAFGTLVNDVAKSHPGQSKIAKAIRLILEEENHSTLKYDQIQVKNQTTTSLIQDRYSLRCTPQVLGPVDETLTLIRGWLEREVNSVSDNPLIHENGELATGGNFYGGYLGQGMDYLKISLGQIADLIDRQLMQVIDEKSNRGLPANLANWPGLPEEERFLHHGLKGLHQSVSAITSEILAKTVPNTIFSRSSESHNQDKVSLGMSAGMQCSEVIDSVFRITSMHLICLAQALDLRGIPLTGSTRKTYDLVRSFVPFVERDRSLGEPIEKLAKALRIQSQENHYL